MKNDGLDQVINLLTQYKDEFIQIGTNDQQKMFLKESFLKWYMNVNKIGEDELFPENGILTRECWDDIRFANKNRGAQFSINTLNKAADALYGTFRLLYDQQENGEDYGDGEGPWISTKSVVDKHQHDRLKKMYAGNNFAEDFKTLCKIYEFMEIGSTIHLSIPPIYKGIELFGSCINTHNDEYCSPFKLEERFSSLGSFWDYKFHRNGIYFSNPPFNLILIKRMAHKLLQDLHNTEHDVVIVQVLPIWDSTTQKKIEARNYKMEFEGYELLVHNQFLKEKIILNKEDYKYWNYCEKKHTPATHTHLIILSNMNNLSYKRVFNIEKFTQAWKDFSASGPVSNSASNQISKTV